MKVEIDTKERAVFVSAHQVTKDPAVIENWIKALRVAQKWLREQRAAK